MKSFFAYALIVIRVLALCVVQLLLMNSGVGIFAAAEIGIIALVVSIVRQTPFFWYILIIYPVVLSWYSSAPFFIDIWVYAIIALILLMARIFLVKEDYFLVRFGFVSIATIVWYIIEACIVLVIRSFGYEQLSEPSFVHVLTQSGMAIIVHTSILAMYGSVEHVIKQRKRYA